MPGPTAGVLLRQVVGPEHSLTELERRDADDEPQAAIRARASPVRKSDETFVSGNRTHCSQSSARTQASLGAGVTATRGQAAIAPARVLELEGPVAENIKEHIHILLVHESISCCMLLVSLVVQP